MINIKEHENLSIINHSCAHVMAQAVKRLYPNALFWVGPIIDEGFYYDIDLGDITLNDEDLEDIAKEMKKIIKDGKRIVREELTKEEALVKFASDPYKIDLINNMENDIPITCYSQGDFTDLCRGPHAETVKACKHFKLLKHSGAYWKGNMNNKMLQRIYGICFENESDLNEYLEYKEKAKERDHRKLGKDLDLFCFSDLVGPGLPLFTPKGTFLKEELQREVERICRSYGFEKVSNPHLANIKLFEISGHAAKFSEELFHVSSEKGHDMVLKPVLCPHHTQLYASKIRSYRDLPVRYMESEKQYRAELPGAVSGLSRVYAITVEDGHIFCRADQIKEEIIKIINIIKDFYGSLGMWGNHWVSLSVRDYNHLDKYIGEQNDWEICENMLEEISDELGLNAKRCEGEAALYGPKLDFMFHDVIGREIQIPTIQLDFATPKRFELNYIDSDGNKKNPVMIHRAILGSYERFMMLLLEHFGGLFPLWLAPVQINIIPVNLNYHEDYAREIYDLLIQNNFRTELDLRNEKLGYKLRESLIKKIPYTIILGQNEVNNKTISYRSHGSEETFTISQEEFIEIMKNKIDNKETSYL